MTTTRGTRLADQSDRSQAIADAYSRLLTLVETDERFAAIREQEVPRLREAFGEYESDAEDLREQALLAGFDPMTER